MDNCKIKVKDEQNFKEVVSLINTLGYGINFSYSNASGEVVKGLFLKGNGLVEWTHRDTYFDLNDSKELTLPQLRDLVVLKRNDINDANCIDKKREAWYLASDGTYYAWQYRKLCWDTESDACVEAHDIKPIIKHLETATGRFDENGEHHLTFSKGTEEKGPALISGAEALRALADGKDVEANNSDFGYWIDARNLSVKDFFDDIHIFRLKPQTIKLELELPKPFEPKVGEEYFYLNSGRESGFAKKLHDGKKLDYMATQFGAWRTEEEIKQVVEQLRKIRGTNS
jgi:hypothetical protein